MKFFFYFFCRNRNHLVPRACNTRFQKIVFDSAEKLDFLTFPRMHSMRSNRFRVCSVCDEIRSAYAQWTKVKILTKKFYGQLIKKIWFRVCSVTAEMFENRNSGENRRNRSEIFFENLRRAYKDFIQVKKFQIISCLCTFKTHFSIS